MEHVDNEVVETIFTLYCGNQSHQNTLIQLFSELADLESVEDPIPLGEEHEVQDLCAVVLISYVDSQSTVRRIDIDLNAAPVSENQNLGSHLQIHPVVFETGANGDDGYDNSYPSNHKVYSDPNLDEVLDDINDEGMNDDGNDNASLAGNLTRCIVICNDPGAHMSLIDPDMVYAVEFSKYPDILPAHRLAVDSEPDELFMGKKFATKKECVFFIKRYVMNLLVDYKVAVSKLTFYIGECWRSTKGYNWRVRATFI
ncbi:hypothetical protein PVK06_048188 [Gossypium arboreum]|uniref:Uncharacterized protein n=1 Tax=Gossypium arboreum TaxID=29729 RepID=A0ABR0MH94_GOSAR|nr:hypothetical protein PVK06_048188 [Gossypium arboreum]